MALRRLLPALCDKSETAPAGCCRPVARAAGCAAFLLDNAGPGSRWPRLLLLYNADSLPHAAVLPDGPWQLLADGTDSFAWQTTPARLLTDR